MPNQTPTTREIAEACGYNQSTVSHALRGHSKIPEATRKQIRQVAEKMGWRANPLAAAYMSHLRSTRTPSFQASLGFLNSHSSSAQIGKLPLYMQRHYNGARQRAGELGYVMEPIWLHEPHLSARRLTSILRSRNISGLVIPGILKPSALLDKLDWRHYAVVALGYSLKSPSVHRVAVNTSLGFHLMLAKAVELGYRHIAVVISESYDSRVNHGVYYPAYYMQRQLRQTHKIDIYRFAEPDADSMGGIQKWVKRHRPEIILGEEIVWHSLREMAWRVPQDSAFIVTDWSPEYPKNAGFNQHHELHGAVAADMVISSLVKNEYGLPAVPRLTLIEGEFAKADSAPHATKRAAIRTPVNL